MQQLLHLEFRNLDPCTPADDWLVPFEMLARSKSLLSLTLVKGHRRFTEARSSAPLPAPPACGWSRDAFGKSNCSAESLRAPCHPLLSPCLLHHILPYTAGGHIRPEWVPLNMQWQKLAKQEGAGRVRVLPAGAKLSEQ